MTEWLASLVEVGLNLSAPELAILSGVLASIELYPHLATVYSFGAFGDVTIGTAEKSKTIKPPHIDV